MADLSACDRVTATELLAQVSEVRSWLDALEAALVGRVDETVLGGDGRRSSRETRTVAARVRCVRRCRRCTTRWLSGTVATGHVDAVARVAGQVEHAVRAQFVEQAESLVEPAAVSSVDWFERHVRDLARHLADDDGLAWRERIRRQRSLRRWTDRQTGLCHTHVALDPEADARLSASLDAAIAAERAKPDTEDRTFDQLRADAFVAAVTGPRTGERRPAEVSVLIDYDTLADGTHDHSVCETSDGQPLPPESVRRIACDATIIPIVLDGAGVVLDHGRGRRVATESQRRALRAMYRTCGFPDCTVRFGDCDIHHVIHWIRQRGPTDLDNLLAALFEPPPPRPRRRLAHHPAPGPHAHRPSPRRLSGVRRLDRRRRPDRQRGDLELDVRLACSGRRADRPPQRHDPTRPAGAAAVGDSGRRSASEYLVRLASALDTRIPPATRPRSCR